MYHDIGYSWSLINNIQTTSHTIDNLESEEEYCVKMRAITYLGIQSPWSDPVRFEVSGFTKGMIAVTTLFSLLSLALVLSGVVACVCRVRRVYKGITTLPDIYLPPNITASNDGFSLQHSESVDCQKRTAQGFNTGSYDHNDKMVFIQNDTSQTWLLSLQSSPDSQSEEKRLDDNDERVFFMTDTSRQLGLASDATSSGYLHTMIDAGVTTSYDSGVKLSDESYLVPQSHTPPLDRAPFLRHAHSLEFEYVPQLDNEPQMAIPAHSEHQFNRLDSSDSGRGSTTSENQVKFIPDVKLAPQTGGVCSTGYVQAVFQNQMQY